MTDNNVVIGGFPALINLHDHNKLGGIFCRHLLFNDQRPGESREQYLANLPLWRDYENMLEDYKRSLPNLFALMHFHMDYLKKGSKVAVVRSIDPNPRYLGWLEIKDGVVHYVYYDPFINYFSKIMTSYYCMD